MTEQNTGNDPANVDDPNKNNDPNNEPANDPGNDPAKNENMIPKSRFDQLNEKKKQAEQSLQEVADSFMEDVPEDYKDIVPDLSPAEKIKWIKSAQKKGLFNKQAEASPDAETPGKGNKQTDTSNMSSFDLLSHGFKNQKKQ